MRPTAAVVLPLAAAGDVPSKLIVIKCALRTQLSLPNRQSIIATQDKLSGPVYLVECPQRSGRFPTQLAQLGMQPGRIAERIEQLTKRCGCPRRKQLLIDSPMSAEEDREGGAVDEPGPYDVANTAFDDIVIIPLIAPKHSFGQTSGELYATPARGGFEHWSVGVARGIIVNVGFHIEMQTCQSHPFDTSCSLDQEKGTHRGRRQPHLLIEAPPASGRVRVPPQRCTKLRA
jgi:hypothetical protein